MKTVTSIVLGVIGLLVVSFLFRMFLGTLLYFGVLALGLGVLALAGVGVWTLLFGGLPGIGKKALPGAKLSLGRKVGEKILTRRLEKKADQALKALKNSNPYEEAARRELEEG